MYIVHNESTLSNLKLFEIIAIFGLRAALFLIRFTVSATRAFDQIISIELISIS